MKKILLLLLSVSIILLSGCNLFDSFTRKNNVSIISISPNSNINTDSIIEFTVEIQYSYNGIGKSVLDIFYTNDSITYEQFTNTAININPGVGHQVFTINTTPHYNRIESSAGFLVSLDSNPEGMFNNRLASDFKPISFNK
jgi:hypothetical protein